MTPVEGPPAQALAERLARCPADFLAAPRIRGSGDVAVGAVVSDLIEELGGEPLDGAGARRFQPRADTPAARNHLSAVLVTSWLLHDEVFRCGGHAAAARALLEDGLDAIAQLVPARLLVTDPDRRMELARTVLAGLGILPAGESAAEAADRLAALDSVSRARVLAETRAAAQRAEEVRAAMRAAAAAEAAARAMPE